MIRSPSPVTVTARPRLRQRAVNITRSTLDLSDEDDFETSGQDDYDMSDMSDMSDRSVTDSEEQDDECDFRPSDLNLDDATSEEMVRVKRKEILRLIEDLGT